MTNENQPKLEDKLLEVGNLVTISRELDRAKTPSEYAQLYQPAAMILGGKEKALEILKELTRDPAYAQMTISGGIDIRAKEIETEYNDQKVRITQEIADKIDASLNGIKNKQEAASKVSEYLEDLFNIPELDQATANRYAQDGLRQATRIPYSFEAEGSIEQYRDKHKSLISRIASSEYLSGNDESGYKIDGEKFKEIMDKVKTGAVVYNKAKAIEEEAERQKQAT